MSVIFSLVMTAIVYLVQPNLANLGLEQNANVVDIFNKIFIGSIFLIVLFSVILIGLANWSKFEGKHRTIFYSVSGIILIGAFNLIMGVALAKWYNILFAFGFAWLLVYSERLVHRIISRK